MNRLTIWGVQAARRAEHFYDSVFARIQRNCLWRNAAVVMVTCALALAVATRYTDYSQVGTQGATSVAVHHNLENKRQHIEKSTFTWIFSLATFANLTPPPSCARVISSDAPLLKVLHSEDLYSRPPPFAS